MWSTEQAYLDGMVDGVATSSEIDRMYGYDAFGRMIEYREYRRTEVNGPANLVREELHEYDPETGLLARVSGNEGVLLYFHDPCAPPRNVCLLSA